MKPPYDSERTCIVTGETAHPAAMLRFVLSPDDVVTPDIRRKLPGHGAWTKWDARVVEKASVKMFTRAFKRNVVMRPDLACTVDSLLREDVLQFLSLVNKSGGVIAGATKIEAALRAGGVIALIHAREAAADGVEKLDRLGCGVTKINLFTNEELSLALGRPNVIHVAVTAGHAGGAFLERIARVEKYRVGWD